MAWLYLVIASGLECGWAIGIKFTDGFSRPIPSLLTVIAMIASFRLLSLAMKTIPVGTAYAVWTGIGAAGVAVMGMLLFDESTDLARIISLLLIISGVVGLRIFSSGVHP